MQPSSSDQPKRHSPRKSSAPDSTSEASTTNESEDSEDYATIREELGLTDEDLGEVVSLHRDSRPRRRMPYPDEQDRRFGRPLRPRVQVDDDGETLLETNEYHVLSEFFKSREDSWWDAPREQQNRDVGLVIESAINLSRKLKNGHEV